MRSVLEAGFIFWGLFATFGLIVVLYLVWMWRVEGRGRAGGRPATPQDQGRPGGDPVAEDGNPGGAPWGGEEGS